MTTQQSINDSRSIVERKLSEIYTHIVVAIPFEFYDRYVDEAYDRLVDNGIDIDKCAIAENQHMIDDFDREIKQWAKNIDFDDLQYDPTPNTDRIFKAELKEAARLQELERKERERQQMELEAAKRAEEAARIKAEAHLLEQIPVTKKNHAKALAILRAAGLTK